MPESTTLLTPAVWAITLGWLGGSAVVFLFAAFKIVRKWTAGGTIPFQWPLLLGLSAFAARVPGVLRNQVTNVDEAQTIAHALTLIHFPQPWKSIDFTTNGPLNAYVFFLPHWAGLPKDYLVSHVILILLQILLVWAVFTAVRNWQGREIAMVVLVPLLAFLGFAQHQDFTHQSSETWCIVPLSVAIAVFSGLTQRPETSRGWRWFWVGLCLGMVPFGKPQGVPPALLAAAMVGFWILNAGDRKSRWTDLAWFVAGGMTMTGIFAVLVVINDAQTDFYDLYIKANLSYAAQHGSGSGFFPGFIFGWARRTEVAALFWLVVVSILLGAGSGSRLTRRDKWLGVFLAGITYAGAYAVERAGRPFEHYMLLFAFPGLFLLLGWGVQRLAGANPRGRSTAAVAALLFFGYVVFYNRALYPAEAARMLKGPIWEMEVSPAAHYVRKWITEPSDCITVYGYYNELYVETQLPSAARTVTVYQHSVVSPEIYTPYYYADLVKNQPVVIVDALDIPGDFRQQVFVNRAAHSPDKIPLIRQFIQKNYQLAATMGKGLIYVRNDRYFAAGALQ